LSHLMLSDIFFFFASVFDRIRNRNGETNNNSSRHLNDRKKKEKRILRSYRIRGFSWRQSTTIPPRPTVMASDT
jgi:hypothetical protein